MSKNKSRLNTDVCADCGATDPTWASINRGILVCVQCCNTHRSLGRHISIVKSLKSVWPASLLAMVHALNSGGANSIWEYALDKDSKLSKRKPQSTDSLEEKAKFIKAKHQNHEFLQRPLRDDTLCMENELGKQLHASVRSSNVIMSLKLLLQGADPNYFHDEKGSTPLHAAVKANQLGQCELLIVYGADPTYPDAGGNTPIHYAKQGINTNVLNRLVEAQYEVTDKFSQFLCMRKPDHQNGVHFLMPKVLAQSSASASEKLRKLPNNVFEELVKDVSDEVDRRETEAAWLGSSDTIDLPTVPFLPVNPSFSTTRNQSRQKLARFATPELKALVRDILEDVQRRQRTRTTSLTDDDPLYDSVASDDDYAQVASDDGESNESPQSPASQTTKQSPSRDVNQNVKPPTKPQSPQTLQNPHQNYLDNDKYVDLMKKLRESTNTITDLKGEVVNLKALVEHLSNVNHELRSRLSHVDTVSNGNHRMTPSPSPIRDSGSQSLDPGLLHNRHEDSHSLSSLTNERVTLENNNDVIDRGSKRIQRPNSMYETREGLRTLNWQTMKNQIKQHELSNRQPLQSQKNQNVMQCIEPVTRGISDLWKCIQGSGRDNCIHHADRICFAVTNLTKAIPAEAGSEVVRQLLESVAQLQANCIGLQNAKMSDTATSEKYMTQVRTCAYEIAKATKELLTKYNAH